MAQILSEFLEREAARPSPFWGERDCLMFICNWIKLARGIDPAAPYRGHYRTELGCLRILKRDGGVREIMRARTKACGIHLTQSPRDGDIILIEGPTLRRGKPINAEAGAIYINDRAATMTPQGLLLLKTPWLLAWTI